MQERSTLDSELAMAFYWCDLARVDDLREFLDNNTRRWLEKGHYQRPVKWIRLIGRGKSAPADVTKKVLKHI